MARIPITELSDKLKPCPYCGSEELDISYHYMMGERNGKRTGTQIYCKKCGAYGPMFKGRHEDENMAAECWNTRA